MARVSETIPVLFVPGVNDVGVCPSPESIARYHSQYGCDFYGFWFGGTVRYSSAVLCGVRGEEFCGNVLCVSVSLCVLFLVYMSVLL